MGKALAPIIILAGHYGAGKTNLAVNLAVHYASQGEQVTLVDLDIVNPYFRSADFQTLAEEHGFQLEAPPYARTNLDMPVLTGAIDGLIRRAGSGRLLIDVGGDSDGAIALGRYASQIQEQEYSFLYVINQYRYLTQTPEEALEFLYNIEAAARLSATHLVNNSNLSYETTLPVVLDSLPFAKDVAKQGGLPLLFTAVKESLLSDIDDELRKRKIGEDTIEFFPVEVYVTSPWEIEEH